MSHIKQVLSTIPFLHRDGGKYESGELQNIVREVLPDSRVGACFRHRLGGSSVVVSTTNRGTTRLGGLMICDAGHICPICHARKMAKEQQIVSRLVHDHYQAGGVLVDAVLTVPHRIDEPLATVLDRLNSTWRGLRGSPIWKGLTRELGIVGCVRRLEVTLGNHGWHPHLHVSFLCKLDLAQEIKGHSWRTALEDTFSIVASHWRAAGKKTGIAISEEAQAAVAIIGHVDAQRAVAYNTKNMGYCKKPTSLTPMDLLRVVAQANDGAIVCAAKRLFEEYATVIKGKHALTYIGSAKASRNTAVKSAEAVCAEVVEDTLGTVSPEAWRAIVKAGLREALAVVTSRREVVAIMLRAALGAGHVRIPLCWMRLAFTVKTKTVIRSSHGLAPEAMAVS